MLRFLFSHWQLFYAPLKKRLFLHQVNDLNLKKGEVIAHLDYAEAENKIAVELQDGVEFYKKL